MARQPSPTVRRPRYSQYKMFDEATLHHVYTLDQFRRCISIIDSQSDPDGHLGYNIDWWLRMAKEIPNGQVCVPARYHQAFDGALRRLERDHPSFAVPRQELLALTPVRTISGTQLRSALRLRFLSRPAHQGAP
jgi:hypothetical protein